jgi:hypothetical protein
LLVWEAACTEEARPMKVRRRMYLRRSRACWPGSRRRPQWQRQRGRGWR